MSSFKVFLASPLALLDAWSQHRVARLVPLLTFHLAAIAIAVGTETGLARIVIFFAAWGLVNFFWLTLLGRPTIAAALSSTLLVTLIFVSRFKFDVLWMAASFVDVMIIDADTVAFLWMMFPAVRIAVGHREYDAIREGVAAEGVEDTITPLTDPDFSCGVERAGPVRSLARCVDLNNVDRAALSQSIKSERVFAAISARTSRRGGTCSRDALIFTCASIVVA